MVATVFVLVFLITVVAQKSLPSRSGSTEKLTIKIPALPRPTLKEIQAVFPWINKIDRDTSPTEASTLQLATVLSEGELSIGDEEYERRRVAMRTTIFLGYQQAVWLVEHQDEFPEFMALGGTIYIDFTGLVIVDGVGGHDFPFLVRRGARWKLDCGWSGRGADARGRAAFST